MEVFDEKITEYYENNTLTKIKSITYKHYNSNSKNGDVFYREDGSIKKILVMVISKRDGTKLLSELNSYIYKTYYTFDEKQNIIDITEEENVLRGIRITKKVDIEKSIKYSLEKAGIVVDDLDPYSGEEADPYLTKVLYLNNDYIDENYIKL
jgi:hypothetical protein